MRPKTGLRATLVLVCVSTAPMTLSAMMCVPRPVECVGSGCVPPVEPNASAPEGLPLIDIDDFEYAGAFTMPVDTFGESRLSRVVGTIEQAGDSLFIAGHPHDNAIAEFIIPELVVSTDIAALNDSGPPVQAFSEILDRATGGNTQNTNRLTGMEVIDGKLVVNAHEWYDGDSSNTHTTLVIDSAADIAGSSVEGYFELPGGAKSGGWISPVPPEWQGAIGTDYITGYSSVTSINSRHSIGPSAHAVQSSDLLGATLSQPKIPTTKLMEFSLAEPLNGDLFNESRTNDLWTHLSGAVYGFIVPGTSTYATVGFSGGHDTGVGYKPTQDDGNLCGGYCAFGAADRYNQYWLWDVNDLLDVKAGKLAPSAVLPYDYGQFPTPFQGGDELAHIGGGTFDETSGTLYLTLVNADRVQNRYDPAPIIVAYRFPSVK